MKLKDIYQHTIPTKHTSKCIALSVHTHICYRNVGYVREDISNDNIIIIIIIMTMKPVLPFQKGHVCKYPVDLMVTIVKRYFTVSFLN